MKTGADNDSVLANRKFTLIIEMKRNSISGSLAGQSKDGTLVFLKYSQGDTRKIVLFESEFSHSILRITIISSCTSSKITNIK